MVIVTINKREMNFNKVNKNGKTIYELPNLSDINKNGKKCYWEIMVFNNMIYRKSYQEGGKIREYPEIICQGKNIGKLNETTDHEQALFEAFSLWTKKQSSGYNVDVVEEVVTKKDGNKSENDLAELVHLPMLANRYEDKKHNLINGP